MKPILYASNETDFTHNGIGTLYDCISAVVTEERNGIFELEIEYPISGAHYESIAHSSIIKCITHENGTNQLFRVYKIEELIGGKCIINAEHISYQLNHIPCAPFTAESSSEALEGFAENALEDCPFTFWTDITSDTEYVQEVPASIRQRLGGEAGSILDTYGGEYEFDNFEVKLHANRGTHRDVTLRYGKNITDIVQEENIESTITGICPYWSGSQMNEDGSETRTLVTLPENVLHSETAAYFPYQRTVPLDMTNNFSEQPTVEQLRAAAEEYISRSGVGIPSVSISISFVSLWATEEYKYIAPLERVYLCDTINVYFEPLKINTEAEVIQTKYNVLLEKYDSIHIGNAKSSFAQTVISETDDIKKEIKTIPSINDMDVAIKHATELLSGGLGGYVVFMKNANGEPEEILILDNPDAAQATNVLRLNKNGIGFSTTGYEGPYTTAWTIDGNFVADFITSGVLNATLLKTGIIRDTGHIEDGQIVHNFNFNINTGECTANNIDIVANTFSLTSGDSLEKIREDMEDMEQVTSVSEQYAVGPSSTTAPGSNMWHDTQPSWVSSNYYLWTRTKITKSDGTVTYSTPVAQTAYKGYMDAISAATADSAIADYDSLLDQAEVFAKLTNNGSSQGIYLVNGEIYINAAMIAANQLAINGIPLAGFDTNLPGNLIYNDTNNIYYYTRAVADNCSLDEAFFIQYPNSTSLFMRLTTTSDSAALDYGCRVYGIPLPSRVIDFFARGQTATDIQQVALGTAVKAVVPTGADVFDMDEVGCLFFRYKPKTSTSYYIQVTYPSQAQILSYVNP